MKVGRLYFLSADRLGFHDSNYISARRSYSQFQAVSRSTSVVAGFAGESRQEIKLALCYFKPHQVDVNFTSRRSSLEPTLSLPLTAT